MASAAAAVADLEAQAAQQEVRDAALAPPGLPAAGHVPALMGPAVLMGAPIRPPGYHPPAGEGCLSLLVLLLIPILRFTDWLLWGAQLHVAQCNGACRLSLVTRSALLRHDDDINLDEINNQETSSMRPPDLNAFAAWCAVTTSLLCCLCCRVPPSPPAGSAASHGGWC